MDLWATPRPLPAFAGTIAAAAVGVGAVTASSALPLPVGLLMVVAALAMLTAMATMALVTLCRAATGRTVRAVSTCGFATPFLAVYGQVDLPKPLGSLMMGAAVVTGVIVMAAVAIGIVAGLGRLLFMAIDLGLARTGRPSLEDTTVGWLRTLTPDLRIEVIVGAIAVGWRATSWIHSLASEPTHGPMQVVAPIVLAALPYLDGAADLAIVCCLYALFKHYVGSNSEPAGAAERAEVAT